MQHLLKDSDLNKAQIEALIALGKAVKADPKKYSQALAGKRDRKSTRLNSSH